MHSSADRFFRRACSTLRAAMLAVSALLAVAIVTTDGATGLTSAAQQPDAPARTQLLELHRTAVAHLREATREGAPSERVALALRETSRALEALAAEPPPSTVPGTAAQPLLGSDLRDELRRAAQRLGALRVDDRQGAADTWSPIFALLDKVHAQLEPDAALGLTFQGSFSRSKPREPAYGGHASAMGPAPVSAPLPDDGAPVLVTFEEGARLPVKSYCGGPTKDHILESACGGIALFDYDEDGRLDIYVTTAAQLTPARERIDHRNALYRNLGGWKFEDVSKQAGVDVAGWGSGTCAGDVDNDGHLDLYVTNWGPNVLFRNRGDGTFADVAAAAGVAAGGWSTGCTFFDADADGDLDLYVARYVQTSWDSVRQARRSLVWRNGPQIMIGPAGLPGESDLFFENVGDGRFVEATDSHGLSDVTRAYGFTVVATDYDDDGFVDLFVANDSNPNFLYRNLGDGRFESRGLAAGVGVNGDARAQAGMGADAGDYDGDSRMDLALTTFAHDRYTIYRNIDGRQFEDASIAAGIAAPTFVRMGWGTAFVDADLDGRLDLFFANGHIFPDVESYPELKETYRQRNQLLLNMGARFRDVSERAGAGLQLARVGRGLAVGDLDNDGDPDLVINNTDDSPTVLENRQSTKHHWLAVEARSPAGNRFAVGAKITVAGAGRTQLREVRSGGSFLSQNDLRMFFGLGTHSGPVDVEVRLPGGDRWQWKQLPVDRLHRLELAPAAKLPRSENRR
jgi:hypothetical protein